MGRFRGLWQKLKSGLTACIPRAASAGRFFSHSFTILVLIALGFAGAGAALFALFPELSQWDFWKNKNYSEAARNWLWAGTFVLGLVFLIWRTISAGTQARAARSQAETAIIQARTAEQGHITERFTKAVEMLGADKLEVRLGAIYALERIAQDSPRDYWTIMETLTAFVRENAPWPPKAQTISEIYQIPNTGEPSGDEPAETEDKPKVRPRRDIQAILTVLGRRSEAQRKADEEKRRHLDLSETDLRGANLVNAHLEGANLVNAHLERANLFSAHLEGANLFSAHLEGANLFSAHLEGASLFSAHLQGADLAGAHLERAILRRAHLEGANLRSAHLEGADLFSANLERACLIDAVGLSAEQVGVANIDEKTTLPEGLREQVEALRAQWEKQETP